MFEGDMDEGELEIGQVSGSINDILPARQILTNMMDKYNSALSEMALRAK